MDTEYCKECNGRTLLDWAAGDIVCSNCGLVQGHIIDDKPNFGDEYDPLWEEPQKETKASIYLAVENGFSAQQMTEDCIKKRKFWKDVEKLNVQQNPKELIIDQVPYTRINRLIHECDLITDEEKRSSIKKAYELYEKVSRSMIQSTKKDKLLVSVLYVVLPKKCTMSRFCTLYKISPATLKKHIHMLTL